jgi:hypothetical protein
MACHSAPQRQPDRRFGRTPEPKTHPLPRATAIRPCAIIRLNYQRFCRCWDRCTVVRQTRDMCSNLALALGATPHLNTRPGMRVPRTWFAKSPQFVRYYFAPDFGMIRIRCFAASEVASSWRGGPHGREHSHGALRYFHCCDCHSQSQQIIS